MSRIGKQPIPIPDAVEVSVSNSNQVTVKGKLGELQQQLNPDITVNVKDGVLILERPSDQKNHKALHGLYRALLANMVKGVSEGFQTVQELVGVGYKVQANGQVLELSLGYSHNIVLELPTDIKVKAVTERGKSPTITLTSHDKQLLGQVAAKIRSFRPPEPYKGKGILFKGEIIRRKTGKAAAEK